MTEVTFDLKFERIFSLCFANNSIKLPMKTLTFLGEKMRLGAKFVHFIAKNVDFLVFYNMWCSSINRHLFIKVAFTIVNEI